MKLSRISSYILSGTVPARRFIVRFLLLSGAWIVLTDGVVISWVVGMPTVIAATTTSMFLLGHREPRLRLHKLPSFAVFFAFESIRSGLDVAFRAFHPRLPIRPGCLRAPPGATHRSGRGLVAATVNLLPGTLTIEDEAGHMLIHVLDTSRNNLKDVGELRQRVATLFVHSEKREMEM